MVNIAKYTWILWVAILSLFHMCDVVIVWVDNYIAFCWPLLSGDLHIEPPPFFQGSIIGKICKSWQMALMESVSIRLSYLKSNLAIQGSKITPIFNHALVSGPPLTICIQYSHLSIILYSHSANTFQ